MTACRVLAHGRVQVDGEERQRGSTSKMIFNVPYLIHYLSNIMTLQHGDIILTGTPEGVGPVKPGQVRLSHVFRLRCARALTLRCVANVAHCPGHRSRHHRAH